MKTYMLSKRFTLFDMVGSGIGTISFYELGMVEALVVITVSALISVYYDRVG